MHLRNEMCQKTDHQMHQLWGRAERWKCYEVSGDRAWQAVRLDT